MRADERSDRTGEVNSQQCCVCIREWEKNHLLRRRRRLLSVYLDALKAPQRDVISAWRV